MVACFISTVAALLLVIAPPCARPPAPCWVPAQTPPFVFPPSPPLPPCAELLANVAVLTIRLPPSARMAPPRAAPPSSAIWPPKQSGPKASPPRPPVAPSRLKVELLTVTVPRLYRPPPPLSPPKLPPFCPVPALPPVAAQFSNVVSAMLTVPPPTY